MLRSAHLLVDVSAHGFGHLAQVSPVLAALRERRPGLRLTVRTALPREVVARRIPDPVEVRPGVPEVGLIMRSGLEVALDESARAYAALHADWAQGVARAAAELDGLRPDLVLADVPYLSLAAAATVGVPAVALCSLNWADVYAHYLGARPEAARVLAEIRSAYECAGLFLQPRPHMPMRGLPRRRPIGPVAGRGRPRRAELDRTLRLGARQALVLVGLGGVETRLPTAAWPRITGVHWLLPASWGVRRADVTALESLTMPFLDLLASCDLLVTKTGYGSFVEAACSGVPVAYLQRPDWPEQPYLADWLAAHVPCRALDPAGVGGAAWLEVILELLDAPRPAPVTPTGNLEAATVLAGLLDDGRGP